MDNDVPDAPAVRAQVEKILESRSFRGVDTAWRFRELVEMALKGVGPDLFEWEHLDVLFFRKDVRQHQDSDADVGESRGSRVRGAMRYMRRRVQAFYDSEESISDQIVIGFVGKSYRPVIVRRSKEIPPLSSAASRLVTRAKIAITSGAETHYQKVVGWHDSLRNEELTPLSAANLMFIALAAEPLSFSVNSNRIDHYDKFRGWLSEEYLAFQFEPWEFAFGDGCILACRHHQWSESLRRLEVANLRSRGEAASFWWLTAVMACQGKVNEAIELLTETVEHFDRRNVAARCQLGLLQTIAGRYVDAEQTLIETQEFAGVHNTVVATHLMILWEACNGDVGKGVLDSMHKWEEWLSRSGGSSADHSEWHHLSLGMIHLTALRGGSDPRISGDAVGEMMQSKKEGKSVSTLSIALICLGLGNFDGAVDALRFAALNEFDCRSMWFHIFPPFRHLRGYAPYEELLKELTLSYGV